MNYAPNNNCTPPTKLQNIPIKSVIFPIKTVIGSGVTDYAPIKTVTVPQRGISYWNTYSSEIKSFLSTETK